MPLNTGNQVSIGNIWGGDGDWDRTGVPTGETNTAVTGTFIQATGTAPLGSTQGTMTITITRTDTNEVVGTLTGPISQLVDATWSVAMTPEVAAALNALPNGTGLSVSASYAQQNTVGSFTDPTPYLGTVACFMPGTLIATPAGEVAVETLQVGDLVLLADGTSRAVRWLGRQDVSTRFADPMRALPVRIKAGALGGGLPKRDLLVSPGHAMLLEGALVHASALVNGTSIVRDHGAPKVFAYFHIDLGEHAVILAEGAETESFVDSADREPFTNWAERESLGLGPVADLGLPRAASARQVPVAVRNRIAAAAAEIGYGAIAA